MNHSGVLALQHSEHKPHLAPYSGSAPVPKLTDKISDDPVRREQSDNIDCQLLKQIATQRSRTAMASLYQGYQQRLMPFLQRMTADHATADEVYNDVMLSIWQKADTFRGQSKVSSWIFTIAYRACLKRLQGKRLSEKLQHLLESEVAVTEAELSKPEFLQFESQDLINKALSSLPAKQRLVVELAYFEGYAIDEIASIVQCPANSVKTRLFHARKKLSAYIEQQERISEQQLAAKSMLASKSTLALLGSALSLLLISALLLFRHTSDQALGVIPAEYQTLSTPAETTEIPSVRLVARSEQALRQLIKQYQLQVLNRYQGIAAVDIAFSEQAAILLSKADDPRILFIQANTADKTTDKTADEIQR